MGPRLASDPRFREIGRFVLVGGVTFLLNLATFYLFFRALRLDYWLAATLAYVITVLCHFAGNRQFTFRAWRQPIARNVARYGLALLVNYLVTLSVTWLVLGEMGLPAYAAVMCYTLANATTSFLLMKYHVFRPLAPAEEVP